jgi:hypothetical protein
LLQRAALVWGTAIIAAVLVLLLDTLNLTRPHGESTPANALTPSEQPEH